MENNELKKLVEELKINMPEITGTDEEKEIKTALYLYVELAKRKTFEPKHYWAEKEGIKRVIELHEQRDSQNVNDIAKRRKITCITISHLYKALLKEFGIRACVEQDIQEDRNILHMRNTIFLKNNEEITVDLQDDIYRIQTRRQLKKFGIQATSRSKEFSEEELTKMLIEVRYINSKEDYRDAKLDSVKRDIQGMDVDTSIKFISSDERVYGGLENLGEVEADRYYKGIIATMFSGKDRGKITQIKCYKKTENGDNGDKYSFLLFVNGKKPSVYLYLPKSKRLAQCSLESLKDLEDEGLQIGKKQKRGNEKMLDKILKKERSKKERNNIGDEAR